MKMGVCGMGLIVSVSKLVLQKLMFITQTQKSTLHGHLDRLELFNLVFAASDAIK